MRHFDLDSVLWCNQWCTLGLAAFRCQATPHQRHPHLLSPWTSTHPRLVRNTLSSMPIAIVCKCRSEDWPIDAYLRRQPNLIADLAMDCSWNSVSHPTYCNDTASNQPALFNHRQIREKTRKLGSIYSEQRSNYEFTSKLWITIDLCESNVPMTTECIAGGRTYRQRYCIRAEKIGNNVLTGILAAQNGHTRCTATYRQNVCAAIAVTAGRCQRKILEFYSQLADVIAAWLHRDWTPET